MKPYQPDEFKQIIYDEAAIRRRVRELGRQISQDYQTFVNHDHDALLAVGLMRGAITFMADLCRVVELPLEYDLLWLSSYEDSDTPGAIQLVKDLKTPVTGRHVLLVEDIVDTGYTLDFALKLFRERAPASIRTCCLLDKRPRRRVEVPLEYVGFVMDQDEFVVGYGLDYSGRYRNLSYIASLHPKVYK